jgi:hypothetical protein
MNFFNLIGESIFVGVYCVVLKRILPTLPLFAFGFLKHFLGYPIIHSIYCNRYKPGFKANSRYLFITSILEGLIFHFFNINVFITGFLLHILFELANIHTLFLNVNCEKSDPV